MRISDWSSDVCSSDLLGVIRHLARYVLKAQPGCPTAEGTCHSPSGFRHTDFLVEGHSTTSLQRVSRSSATSSMVTPKPGPLGGLTWPSRMVKSVSPTSGSGPMIPRPKMNSPAEIGKAHVCTPD